MKGPTKPPFQELQDGVHVASARSLRAAGPQILCEEACATPSCLRLLKPYGRVVLRGLQGQIYHGLISELTDYCAGLLELPFKEICMDSGRRLGSQQKFVGIILRHTNL